MGRPSEGRLAARMGAMVATDWWRTFFSGVVLDMWQQAIPPEYTKVEAEFINNLLNLPSGARILDAPCGEGRIARELAAKGYQIDIGERSPTFPVTPPYMRVRIRRFGGLSDQRTVNRGSPSESK